MKITKSVKPLYVAIDIDDKKLPADAAKFIKGQRIGSNTNPNINGSGADLSMGNNFGVGTPLQSAIACVQKELPTGYNRCLGAYECEETNELYYFNYNENSSHGIYILNGNTMQVESIIDPTLGFSDRPEFAIPAHRVHVKVIYTTDLSGNKITKEKYLLFTDGNKWQRWVDVIAAVKTNTFDATQFPYWKLQPPHFDRREYFEYAFRPPMPAPTWKTIALTPADRRRRNKLLNKSTQFAVQYIYTDGRSTTLSQWSLPYFPKVLNGQGNMGNQPRCLELSIYAGSAMVEQVRLLTKNCKGDWVIYDTINKFTSCDENDPALIKGEYWKRINPWKDLSYNPIDNTFKYKYCGDKECGLFSQEVANKVYTDLPLRSIAMMAAGDAIIFSDNEYDYDNIPCELLKDLEVKLRDDVTASCSVKNVKIRVYSMFCADGMQPGFGYTNGDDKTVRFGGIKFSTVHGVTMDAAESDMFGCTFVNGGPVAYLAGTPYFSVGKQYRVDKNGYKLTEVGLLDADVDDNFTQAETLFNGLGFYVWVHDFVVPAGKYIVRLGRHDVSVSDDYQGSSTYVLGLTNRSAGVGFGYWNHAGSIRSYSKEMEIDACAGDVDVWGSAKDIFFGYVPYDFKYGVFNLWERWKFVEGYIREDNTDKVGIELLRYNADEGYPEFVRGGYHTDHNGHYFEYSAKGGAKDMRVYFWGKWNCAFSNDIIKSNDIPNNKKGVYKDDVYIKDLMTFGLCNRVLVRGTITDTDGNGLEGIAVTITRGRTAYTRADGSYELIVHGDFSGNRVDRMYINSVGSMIITGKDCKCLDFMIYDEMYAPCLPCNERIYNNSNGRANSVVSVVSMQAIGLKGGGRYPIVMIGFDLAGRATYANLLGYANIPTIIETESFTPQLIDIVKSAPLNLPSDIAWISFARGRNLNTKKYIQWVGDKIEFLNHKGEVISGTSGAVRARITIQSLLDYNIENNFSTNTKYSFVTGDFVRIYDDGDGNYFKPDANGFLDLQILGTNWDAANAAANTQLIEDGNNQTQAQDNGASFIVPYDKRLELLKDKCNFWIEISSPDDCEDKEVYCEIPGMYPVINGDVNFPSNVITLQTFDTYYQQRLIINKVCSGKALIHPFESQSITDYWGEMCTSCGRNFVRNENAKRKWYPDQAIKSDDLVNEGGYNGLGTFWAKNKKHFKGQSWGGIVATHAERKTLAFICQNDWFITDYELNVVRINENGVAVATLDQAMSDMHQKIGKNWGLEFEDTQAIIFENGMCFYGDSKNANIVVMDYRDADDLASIDNKSYFVEKFKHMALHNRSCADSYKERIDLVFGFDPLHKELMVTFRPRRTGSVAPASFANDEREIKIDHQETFTFSVEQKKWVRWAGFCPEAYGILRHARTGIEMISFAAGVPFSHNSRGVKTFNNFYSVPTGRVLEIVINDPQKLIACNIIEEDSMQAWFIDRIFTSEGSSFSYVPLSYFKKKENTHYAELLRDMNSFAFDDRLYRIMLLDGKRIFGEAIRMRLVADPRKVSEYSEIDSIHVQCAASAPVIKQ